MLILLLAGSSAMARGPRQPCAEQLQSMGAHFIGVDSDYSYYFEDHGKRGRIWRVARPDPGPCHRDPHCLEVPKQDGITCQSHALLNLMAHLDAKGQLGDSSLRRSIRAGSKDLALQEIVGTLFDDETGDADDELNPAWHYRMSRILRASGIKRSPLRLIKGPRAVEQLFSEVENGNPVFLTFSFLSGSYKVRDLQEPEKSERRRGAFVRDRFAQPMTHAVAVVSAFHSARGGRFLIVLDSNTGTFAVWNVEELKRIARSSRDNSGLDYYYALTPYTQR